MALEYYEGTKRVFVEDIITVKCLDGGPEERVVSGSWEIPVSLFTDAGYAKDQIAVGMEFQYRTRQLGGEPLRTSNFKGILPPVEEVNI